MDRDYHKILYGLLAVFSADKISYFLSQLIPLCAGLLQIVQLVIAFATLTFILVKISQARQQIKYLKEQRQLEKQKRRGKQNK